MNTIIFINIFVIVLSYFSKYDQKNIFFRLAFFIIFLTTSLRFDFGTDYLNYYKIFNEIGQYHLGNLLSYEWQNIEVGWIMLNYISQPIGFFGLIIVISAFLCYTYYSLIKKYIEPKYYWFAIFIYVFTFDIMWIQFSAIRQAVAIAIFIYSIEYLVEKEKIISFILLIIIASMFHASAFFMLPFFIFKYKKIREGKKVGVLILAIFFWLMFYGRENLSLLIQISSFFDEKYFTLFNKEVELNITILGSVAWSILLFIILYYSKFQQKKEKIIFYIVSLYCTVYVIAPLVWLADRIGYYFIAFSVVVFPLIIKQEKRIPVKTGLLFVFISFIIYRFKIMQKLDWVINGYSEYITIFTKIF